MRTCTKKTVALLLAWLVFVPIAVIAPSEPAFAETETAAIDENDLFAPVLPTTIEFGQRVSRASSSAAIVPVPRPIVTHRQLEVPEWKIWPNESAQQVVNLESFLYLSDGFEAKSWCICLWLVSFHFESLPIGSTFEFREEKTGNRSSESCWGVGVPWVLGMTNPLCGKEWEHSSSVTGTVEAKANVVHFMRLWINGYGPIPYFAKSRDSDAKELTVGEVLNVGQSFTVPDADTPEITAESGFCSWWGISTLCWIGETALETALEAIYDKFPFLRQVADALIGCGEAALEQAGGLIDILREVQKLIEDPGAFVSEKLQEFKELIAAIREDPEGFAKKALAGIVQLDRLKEKGGANWVGFMICDLAISFFTGRLGATLLIKIKNWKRDRDRTPPGHPCRISSFAGDTLVLMDGGDYERIDEIRPGDQVLSHNVDTSVWEPQLVVDQWSHLDRGPPATATLADQSTITATDDHLFWRANTSEWIQLQFLRSGDHLLTPAGAVTVDHVVVGPRHDWLVWELTVANNHNFTVLAGDHDLLVHNRSCGEGPDDNLGKPIPGTNRRIGDGPQMDPGPPRRIIKPDGTLQKPRQPSPNNKDFDHSRTRRDPNTGETTYYRTDGSSVTYDADGFPKFDSDADVYLNPDELGSNSNSRDFGAANDKVGEALNRDPGYLDDFPNDVQDFYARSPVPNTPPPGYTWHHHQDAGRMQLVPDGIHGDFPHTGGASIWGK